MRKKRSAAVRIVAGKFRGRRIAAPSGLDTRPSSDRLREALFDILANRYGQPEVGARVLDLFAGSGAFGLEALSRGASHAQFVENGAGARAAIRENIAALGLGGATRLLRHDAVRLGPLGARVPFDLIFADPPYGQGDGDRALAAALAGGWFASSALVVLEERAKNELTEIPGLMLVDSRRIGGSELRFFNVAAGSRGGL